MYAIPVDYEFFDKEKSGKEIRSGIWVDIYLNEKSSFCIVVDKVTGSIFKIQFSKVHVNNDGFKKLSK